MPVNHLISFHNKFFTNVSKFEWTNIQYTGTFNIRFLDIFHFTLVPLGYLAVLQETQGLDFASYKYHDTWYNCYVDSCNWRKYCDHISQRCEDCSIKFKDCYSPEQEPNCTVFCMTCKFFQSHDGGYINARLTTLPVLVGRAYSSITVV